jgi:hypothetical protein
VTTPGRSGDGGAPISERVATLSDTLRDIADNLRRLPESRLQRCAGAARELAQLLADAAAGTEGAPPVLRRVPELNVFALGDQIAVTARDLGDAVAAVDGAGPVCWRGARHDLRDVLDDLLAAAQALRGTL